jgi:hypothetical protein
VSGAAKRILRLFHTRTSCEGRSGHSRPHHLGHVTTFSKRISPRCAIRALQYSTKTPEFPSTVRGPLTVPSIRLGAAIERLEVPMSYHNPMYRSLTSSPTFMTSAWPSTTSLRGPVPGYHDGISEVLIHSYSPFHSPLSVSTVYSSRTDKFEGCLQS